MEMGCRNCKQKVNIIWQEKIISVKFSNIKINNKIFINENATCKIEEKNYKIKEINFQNQNHLKF